MGTNFYLKRKLSQEQKEKCNKLIFDDKYKDAEEILSYTKPIHLGKRSAGWKFLWNVNNFEYFKPDKKSLLEFLNTPNSIIVDEYGREYSVERFLNEEIPIKGFNLLEYYKTYPQEHKFIAPYQDVKRFKEQSGYEGDINAYGEFYLDDFRCTYFDEFS